MKQPIVELEIERMTYGPAAIARKDGLVYMVRGAAPGDVVRAQVTARKRNYCEAIVVEILEPSERRTEPACPYFERCGGCQWQHLNYNTQILEKKQILARAIATAILKTEAELLPQIQTHEAKSKFGYRTRMQVRGQGKDLGFYAEKTNVLVPIERCMVAHPSIQKAWCENKFQSPEPFKIEWTVTKTGEVKAAINAKHGALGFTQINTEQNEVLTSLVTELGQKYKIAGNLLLDLYGGDGNLVKSLEAYFIKIVSVDLSAPPVDPNSKIEFVSGRVDQFLTTKQSELKGNVDIVIADPPRAGIENTVDLLRNIGPSAIILVSCDPQTLGRDIKKLTSDGAYSVAEAHLIDMFPQTFHIESVVVLKSRPKSSLDDLRKLK